MNGAGSETTGWENINYSSLVRWDMSDCRLQDRKWMTSSGLIVSQDINRPPQSNLSLTRKRPKSRQNETSNEEAKKGRTPSGETKDKRAKRGASGKKISRTVDDLKVFGGSEETQSKVAEKEDGIVAYKITVTTGSQKEAGTSAPIYFQMKSVTGEKSVKKRLVDKRRVDRKTNDMLFDSGSKIAFRLSDRDIGDIHSIKIDIDQVYDHENWFCEEVVVKNKSNGKQWSFPCHQWLGETSESGESYCIIEAEGEGDKEARTTLYQITTITGSGVNDGSSTSAVITLYSNSSDTGPIILDKISDSIFKSSKTDVFTVEARELDTIVKVRIRLDDPAATDWFLERLAIKVKSQPGIVYYAWSSDCVSQFGTPLDLAVSTDPFDCLKENRFKITFFTGQQTGSGTSADVFITLYGDNRVSREIKIQNDGNSFSQGTVSEHFEKTNFLGGLVKQLKLSHNSRGTRPEWFVEKVIVDQLDSPKRLYEFLCGRWLSAERDDGSTSVYLQPTGFSSDEPDSPSNLKTFEVTFITSKTANNQEANKPANCLYVVLYGEEKYGEGGYMQVSTHKLLIKGDFVNENARNWLKAVNPSPLTQLEVGLKNENQEIFIDDVIVICRETNIGQVFTCNSWLSGSRDSTRTEKTLYERKEERFIRKPWALCIYGNQGGNVQISGTIRLTFWGKAGKVDNVSIDDLPFGQSVEVMLNDICPLFKATLTFDPSTEDDPELFVEKLTLTGLSVGKKHKYKFDINRALSWKSGPLYSLTTDIPAHSKHLKIKSSPVNKYEITIQTSSENESATSAAVSLALIGEKSDSGYRRLFLNPTVDRNSKLFETGASNVFSFDCVQLGEIDHIVLGHAGQDPDDDWMVEQVLVSCKDTGERLSFPCGKWISASKPGCQPKITLYPIGSKSFCREFTCKILTANVEGSGSDIESAYISLFGSKAESVDLKLSNQKQSSVSSQLFKSGKWSEFKFETKELGELQRIVIGHEDESKKWFVDQVIVDCEERNEQSLFSPNRWLAKDEADGNLYVEVEPKQLVYGIPRTNYKVQIQTGEQGTDGEVFLTICGLWGQTEEIKLRKASNQFSSTSTNEFQFRSLDVGLIEKIRLKFVPDKTESWDLAAVKISRDAPIVVDRHPHEFWKRKDVTVKYNYDNRKQMDFSKTDFDLDFTFKCDRKILPTKIMAKPVVEFVPENIKSRSSKKERQEICYDVTIETSADPAAKGKLSDNRFSLNIFGSKSDTGFREVTGQIRDPGKTATFLFDTVGLGTPEYAIITTELSVNWLLSNLSLKSARKEIFFPADAQFSTKYLGGQINHSLMPMNKNLVSKLLQDLKLKSISELSLRNNFGLEMILGKVVYRIRTCTGSKSNIQGSEAEVYLFLQGNYLRSQKFILSESKFHSTSFRAGQLDEFDLESVDLGEVETITVGWRSKSSSRSFPFDKIEVTAGQIGRQWTFGGNPDDSNDEQYVQKGGFNEKTMDCLRQFTKVVEKTRFYEIKVKTSDKVRGGSTDANVFIQLYGDAKKSQVLELVPRSDLRKDEFKEGKEAQFIRELENVGDTLRKIRIGHDNSGLGAGWHLAWVQIRVLLGEYDSLLYHFECNRWLARDEDDKATERELHPTSVHSLKHDALGNLTKTEQTVQKQKLKKYTVHVYTGSVTGAGTDANVFLTLYGDKSDTGERALKHSDTNINKFEQNDHDVFTIEAADLGELYKCFIRHDNKGVAGAAWFLDKIEVVDSSDESYKTVFYCERWLSKKDDDGKIERTLFAQGYHGCLLEDDLSLPNHTSYVVKVTTGSEKGMDTDANAHIAFFGSDGKSTGQLALRHATKMQFKPSSTEEFHIWAPSVGKALRRIDIGHDGLLQHQDWFVRSVEVDIPQIGKNYIFKMEDWIGSSKGKGKMEKTLLASDGETAHYKPRKPYIVTVQTGDEYQAGTDCKIEMTFFGKKGTSEPIIIPKNEARFERGRKDTFVVNIADIDQLLKIRVSVSKMGFRTKWFLFKIESKALESQDKPTCFNCQSWLDSASIDKRSVTLVAEKDGKKLLANPGYEISVTTSDVRGAGTDANVSIVLFGVFGDSGELELKQSSTHKNKFERKHTDVFSFPHLEDLGDLQKIRIWHDDKGPGSAWHLKEVQVKNESTSKTFKFVCNKWLSRSDEDKQVSRELFAEGFKPGQHSEHSATYRVSIVLRVPQTSPTFAGGVFSLKLKSYNRESKEYRINLDANSTGKREVEHDFEDVNLQNVSGVLVNFEPISRGQIVECEQIHVSNLTEKDTILIQANKKLPDPESENEPVYLRHQRDEKTSGGRGAMANQIDYEIKVFTGKKWGAGTDSNVFLTLFGSKGNSGKHKLADSKDHMNKFETSQVDTFDFKFADLGHLQKLHIEHDNSGQGPGWYLDRVEVTDKVREETTVFPCENWLDKSKGDKQIFRELLGRQQK